MSKQLDLFIHSLLKKLLISWLYSPAMPCVEKDTDYEGSDVGSARVSSWEECQQTCQNEPKCKFWTTNGRGCWMKESDNVAIPSKGLTSGPKFCGGIMIYF